MDSSPVLLYMHLFVATKQSVYNQSGSACILCIVDRESTAAKLTDSSYAAAARLFYPTQQHWVPRA